MIEMIEMSNPSIGRFILKQKRNKLAFNDSTMSNSARNVKFDHNILH